MHVRVAPPLRNVEDLLNERGIDISHGLGRLEQRLKCAAAWNSMQALPRASEASPARAIIRAAVVWLVATVRLAASFEQMPEREASDLDIQNAAVQVREQDPAVLKTQVVGAKRCVFVLRRIPWGRGLRREFRHHVHERTPGDDNATFGVEPNGGGPSALSPARG